MAQKGRHSQRVMQLRNVVAVQRRVRRGQCVDHEGDGGGGGRGRRRGGGRGTQEDRPGRASAEQHVLSWSGSGQRASRRAALIGSHYHRPLRGGLGTNQRRPVGPNNLASPGDPVQIRPSRPLLPLQSRPTRSHSLLPNFVIQTLQSQLPLAEPRPHLPPPSSPRAQGTVSEGRTAGRGLRVARTGLARAMQVCVRVRAAGISSSAGREQRLPWAAAAINHASISPAISRLGSIGLHRSPSPRPAIGPPPDNSNSISDAPCKPPRKGVLCAHFANCRFARTGPGASGSDLRCGSGRRRRGRPDAFVALTVTIPSPARRRHATAAHTTVHNARRARRMRAPLPAARAAQCARAAGSGPRIRRDASLLPSRAAPGARAYVPLPERSSPHPKHPKHIHLSHAADSSPRIARDCIAPRRPRSRHARTRRVRRSPRGRTALHPARAEASAVKPPAGA